MEWKVEKWAIYKWDLPASVIHMKFEKNSMDFGHPPKEGLEDALNPGFALPLTDADDACPAHVRSTSLPNATLNLVLAVLGAGQLTLPYAMGQ